MFPSIAGNGLLRDRREPFVVLELSKLGNRHHRFGNRLTAKFAHLVHQRRLVAIATGQFRTESVEHLIDLIHAVAPHTQGESHPVNVGRRQRPIVGQVGGFTIGFVDPKPTRVADGEDGDRCHDDERDDDEQDGHQSLRTAWEP